MEVAAFTDFPTRLAKEDGTFIDRLKKWSEEKPNEKSLNFYEKGKLISSLTFSQLWRSIERLATAIAARAQPGERVVLMAEPGMDFIVPFYACLRANVIVVPCYTPIPGSEQRGIDVLTNITSSATAKLVLLSQKLALLKKWRGNWPTSLPHGLLDYFTLPAVTDVANQLFPSSPGSDLALPMPLRSDVAFLQFTSGSTGSPKGVIIDHHNLASNCCYSLALYKDINLFYAHKTVVTTWLPMYHDMGLVTATCAPLYFGGEINFMSPLDFLVDPLVWFDVLSLTKSNATIAPNFAYNLVNRKWDSKRAKKWDLSALRFQYNSAEPIQLTTIETFLANMQRDAPSFPVEAYGVGYGMAESVAAIGNSYYPHPLVVSKLHYPLVASMPNAAFYNNTRIVHQETLQLIEIDGEVGEIWVQSPCVSRGYWAQPELSTSTFQNTLANMPGTWLRTGDLGFMEEGHLFVSGRLKDLIIINGSNLYPQDLEASVFAAGVESIRPGCAAVFPVSLEDTESFVIVAEVRQNYLATCNVLEKCERIVQVIEHEIRLRFSLVPHEIVLIKEKTIPKTTSGKIRRKETKRQWEVGELQTLLKFLIGKGGRDLGLALEWVEAVVREKLLSISANGGCENKQALELTDDDLNGKVKEYAETCRRILMPFNIVEQEESLPEQGLDSLRIVELMNQLKMQFGLVLEIAEASSLTSKEVVNTIVLHLCDDKATTSKANLYPSNYPAQIEDHDRIKQELEPPLDPEMLQQSFSVSRRLVCDMLVFSGVMCSLVASLLPAVYCYHLIVESTLSSPWSYWEISNTQTKPYWITLGFAMILLLPCFFIVFTLVWLAQKWMLIGKYRSGFIPIYSTQYYVWLYIDRLTAIWEVTVFIFIADTPLVNIVYRLAGAHVHMDAVISTPLRCADLISVCAFAEIEGFLYPQQLLPNGVSMGTISVGKQSWMRTGSIVHRCTHLHAKVKLEPLAVLPPYHTLEGGHVWQGNICVLTEQYAPEEVQQLGHRVFQWCKLLVLVTLPWMSLCGAALATRFWFVIFPDQPLSNRVGNFWFQVWVFYGTGIAWSVLVLLVKWTILGKARRGPYTPSTFIRFVRYAINYWNNMAMRLFWLHFQLNLSYLWSRMLGATISPTATIVTNCVSHPADADLVEILDDARVSTVIFQPYNKEQQARGRISVGCGAEVGHFCVLAAGVDVGDYATVGSRVFLPADTVIAKKHQITAYTLASQRMALDRKKSFSFNKDLARFELRMHDSFFMRCVCVSSEASAALVPWMPVWLSYWLYRELSVYHAALGLFVALIGGLLSYLVLFAALHRLWDCLEANRGASPGMYVIVVLFWRWLHQAKYVFAQSVGLVFGGSFLLNVALNLAGSHVSMSAVIMYVHLNDWSLYDIEDFAVINEQAFPFGHVLQKNQLRFGRSRYAAFSCMQSFAVLFPNQTLGYDSTLGSHVSAIQDLADGELVLGTAFRLPV